MKYQKSICYQERLSRYVIMVPVFYDYESRPAWRTVYGGTEKECKSVFDTFPDAIKASAEENARNRKNKIQESLFLDSIGQHKRAANIRKQYCIA